MSFVARSQVFTSNINSKDKQFFETLIGVCNYMKQLKTTPIRFHESSIYSKDEAFYDEVIKRYFDPLKTHELFSKDTSLFSVVAKMDMMRHILNGADYFLDIVPKDSIFVRRYNSKEWENILEVYFIVDNKEVSMLLCYFDASSNLLVNLAGGASPRSSEFTGYLKRQKNYYEFPDPRSPE